MRDCLWELQELYSNSKVIMFFYTGATMYFFYFCNDLINCKTLVHCYIINNRDVKQLVKHEQACFILTDSFDVLITFFGCMSPV